MHRETNPSTWQESIWDPYRETLEGAVVGVLHGGEERYGGWGRLDGGGEARQVDVVECLKKIRSDEDGGREARRSDKTRATECTLMHRLSCTNGAGQRRRERRRDLRIEAKK